MIRAESVMSAPTTTTQAVESPGTTPLRPPSVFDFLAVFAAIIAAVVVGWFVWKWSRNRPTRGLRRAVQRAKRLNEQMENVDIPHPAPEMEMRRRAESLRPEDSVEASPFEPAGPRRRDRRPKPQPVELTPADEQAMERLRELIAVKDDKDVREDYRRLDAFVRRYLYETYDVKTFSQSSTALLESLPQDLSEGVVDYVGEILRVCELAELRGHRPSRAEFRQLARSAEEMIANHSRVARFTRTN